MEKSCKVGEATHESIIRRMRFTCWITKATSTQAEYVILLFHDNNVYVNALQCYVIRKMPVLFNHEYA
jgi:hypothetical protein